MKLADAFANVFGASMAGALLAGIFGPLGWRYFLFMAAFGCLGWMVTLLVAWAWRGMTGDGR